MKSLLPPETKFVDTLIPASELSEILGTNLQTIHKLGREGILTRHESGGKKLYRLGEAIRDYLKWLETRNQSPGQILALKRARLVEIQIAKEEKVLVSAVEIQTQWTAKLTTIRQILLSIPARVGENLPHLTQADIQELDRQVRNALTDASET